VARALLGQRLVRVLDGRRTAGIVVETEAYIGEEDLACHASAGRTARNAIMFGSPGYAYVYFIYGMYHCLNIVTEREEFPAAVLIRALAPAEGIDVLAKRRGLSERLQTELDRRPLSGTGSVRPGPTLRALLSGPGRLCQAMAIDRSLNGESLLGNRLFLERATPPERVLPERILATPRIGVDYAGQWRDRPWRFVVADSPWLSGARLRLNGRRPNERRPNERRPNERRLKSLPARHRS
jgi:DNA-3-methyladenine glycosylase